VFAEDAAYQSVFVSKLFKQETQTTCIADKPRDAFVQTQWHG